MIVPNVPKSEPTESIGVLSNDNCGAFSCSPPPVDISVGESVEMLPKVIELAAFR